MLECNGGFQVSRSSLVKGMLEKSIISYDASRLRPLPRQGPFMSNRAIADEEIVLACDSALFAGLSPGECSEIVSYATIATFARNERLFSQDQLIDKLLMIRTGSVKLTQLSPDGKEVILWMNGPGDAVGMHADAVGCDHSCSARPIERCQVLVWEHTFFRC